MSIAPAAANRRRLAPEPMLATLARAPSGEGWAIEQKWDGQRGLAVVDGSVALFSRNGANMTCLGV